MYWEVIKTFRFEELKGGFLLFYCGLFEGVWFKI